VFTSKKTKHHDHESGAGVGIAEEHSPEKKKIKEGPASYSDGHPLDIVQYLEPSSS